MKNSFLLVAGLLLCSVSGAALAAVTASLDQDQVSDGQSVVLTLQKDSTGGGDPDLSPLKKDFDVLGTSSSSNVQIDNGHITTQRVLQLTLSPKHTGTLQIPALTWDGETSQPLNLVVSNGSNNANPTGSAGGAAATTHAHIFITSTLDQQQPYVQAGVVLTVQLHTDQQLYHASMDFSGDNDVLVRQLGKDQQTTEMRDGHQYTVIERQYLLQPQRSGTLSIDGPTLNAQIADTRSQDPFGGMFGNSPFGGMLGTTKPIRLHGDAITLDVRPRPAAASGRDWLPATQVTLEESWKPDNASVHAGDPLTLHLHLSAQGVTGAQLPDLSSELSLPDGLKAYPDQAKLDTRLQSGSVVGSRDQDIALIANQAGQYQIPALRLSWWDTTHDQQRVAELPARTLTILPADAASAAPPPVLATPAAPAVKTTPKSSALAMTPVTTHESASTLWRWVSVALGLLWLITLFAWWLTWRRMRTRKPAPAEASQTVAATPDASRARKLFQAACRDNNPQTARRELLQWAAAVMPKPVPTGLNALATNLKNPQITELLVELDRACYTGAEWQGGALAAALTSLPRADTAKRQTAKLAQLYS